MPNITIEDALAILEQLPSRERIREQVTAFERQVTGTQPDDLRRFLRYIVRPYLAGVNQPVFADEFRATAARFRRLWAHAKGRQREWSWISRCSVSANFSERKHYPPGVV